MSETSEDIRGVLIQVSGGRILLPNATVAEVITMPEPDKVENAPDWLLGRIPWRGWRLPLFSFSVLSGLAAQEQSETARVSVLKALGDHPRLPFMAMLAQGFPRLTTLNADIVVARDIGEQALPPGVLSYVMIRDDEAMIPDMEGIEDMIAEALQLPHEAASETA